MNNENDYYARLDLQDKKLNYILSSINQNNDQQNNKSHNSLIKSVSHDNLNIHSNINELNQNQNVSQNNFYEILR